MKLHPLLIALFLPAALFGAAPTLDVPVEPAVVTTPLHGGIFLLVGRGGNVAVYPSEAGTVMIDDQYAPRSKMLQEAVAQIAPQQPVRLIINTHFHFDHTGGNEAFGAAGAAVLAHDNVRKRLATGEHFEVFKLDQPPTAAPGLPSRTFGSTVTLYHGGEVIEIVHPALGAHTDGDAIVFFRKANVVHTGDIFVRYGLPFIDTVHGGSLQGTIAASEYLLTQVNDDTQIIPGHGAIATKADLATYTAQLKRALAGIEQARQSHKSVDEIVAADPLKGVDLKEANVPKEIWIRLAIEGLEAARK